MGNQPNKLTRRAALTALIGGALATTSGSALAQSTPSASSIERSLGARAPRIAKDQRMSVRELKRNRKLRRIAPSVNIQSINFEFGSSRIPARERWKVQRIAQAMQSILRRNPSELFLVEGHTDAVGSNYNNLALSERRAQSLANQLRRFGVPRRALETIGYGEEDLLVPTQRAEWRNRRVALRRITDFVTYR